jgi:hypothetical protein
VLAAVQKAMSTYGTRTVTTVGHSLGAAISLLDAVSLSRRLPSGTTVKFFGYGLPRVGNPAFASYVDGSGIQVTHINNELDFGAPSGASLRTPLCSRGYSSNPAWTLPGVRSPGGRSAYSVSWQLVRVPGRG